MINPAVVIFQNTVKSSFHLMLCVVNEYGEEKETIFKKSKKKFFAETGLDGFKVKLVDDYPPREMELNTYYVKRDGKSVWLKVRAD